MSMLQILFSKHCNRNIRTEIGISTRTHPKTKLFSRHCNGLEIDLTFHDVYKIYRPRIQVQNDSELQNVNDDMETAIF